MFYLLLEVLVAMENFTVAVMVEHPKTKEMVKQGLSIRVQASGVDKARDKVREAIVEKNLPPIRSMAMSSRRKNHFVVYCAPIEQTKPTPGVDMRWRKPG
jgi:hypothetical protein